MNKRLHALETAAERVARILAQDFDITVVLGDKAAFDGETRTLYMLAFDQMPEDPRVQNAFRGILDHELAHGVHTDFGVIKAALQGYSDDVKGRVHGIWNCFEDPMIEDHWVVEYPGSVHHFRQRDEWCFDHFGGAEVTDPNYANPNGNGQTIGAFGAFLQAIVRVRGGMISIDDVHADTKALMDLCWDEIELGWNAKTTAECATAAKAVWKKLEDPPEPPPPEPEPEEGEDSEEQDGEGESEGDQSQEGDDQDSEGEGEEQEGDGSKGDQKGDGEGDEEASGAGEGDEEGEEDQTGSDDPGESQSEPTGEGEEQETEGKDDGKPNAGGHTGIHDGSLQAEAMRGDFGEIKNWMQDVIASKFRESNPRAPYTVHPETRSRDDFKKYDAGDYTTKGSVLYDTSQQYGRKLTRLLSSAVLASRQSLTLTEVEDGDGITDSALPGIALGLNDDAIYEVTTRRVDKSAFVIVLVDCSGSMESNRMEPVCPDSRFHGLDSAGEWCADCGARAKVELSTKSQYAAVTAMGMHQALRECRVPHAVLGHNTFSGGGYNRRPTNGRRSDGYMQWSRASQNIRIHEFVPAPGTTNSGHALACIDGGGFNCDGEAILEAARYAAHHGGYDRIIMLVLADGLPTGCDDSKIQGPYMRQSIDRVAQAMIEVYGVGIGIGSEEVFRSYFTTEKARAGRAPTGAILLDNATGLNETVLRSLAELISEGYGTTRQGRTG